MAFSLLLSVAQSIDISLLKLLGLEITSVKYVVKGFHF